MGHSALACPSSSHLCEKRAGWAEAGPPHSFMPAAENILKTFYAPPAKGREEGTTPYTHHLPPSFLYLCWKRRGMPLGEKRGQEGLSLPHACLHLTAWEEGGESSLPHLLCLLPTILPFCHTYLHLHL